MQSVIAGIFLLAVVAQCVSVTLLPRLYLLLSPVPSLCCLILLGLLHPGLVAARDRIARLHSQGLPVSYEVLAFDPAVSAALRMPSPAAPFKGTVNALMLMAAADVADGLRVYCDVPDSRQYAAFWEATHHGLMAAAAVLLFLTTRRLGASPSKTIDYSIALAALLAAVQLSTQGVAVGAILRAGWPGNAYLGLSVLRVAACSALAAQATSALTGAVFPAQASLDSSPRAASDVLRWVSQAMGGLLLLAPSAVRAFLTAPVDAGALALGCARLSVGSLTLSGWLAHFPPLLLGPGGCGR